jgi:hypothetical protein
MLRKASIGDRNASVTPCRSRSGRRKVAPLPPKKGADHWIASGVGRREGRWWRTRTSNREEGECCYSREYFTVDAEEVAGIYSATPLSANRSLPMAVTSSLTCRTCEAASCPRNASPYLEVHRRTAERIEVTPIFPVRFVPLTGEGR